VQNLRPSWLVFSEGFNRTVVTRVVKRMVDVVLASLFLALGWPIFVLVALAIRLNSPVRSSFAKSAWAKGADSSRCSSSGRWSRMPRPRPGLCGQPRTIPHYAGRPLAAQDSP